MTTEKWSPDMKAEARQRFRALAGGTEAAQRVLEAAARGHKSQRINFDSDLTLCNALLNPAWAHERYVLHSDVLTDTQKIARRILANYAKIAKVNLGTWPAYEIPEAVSECID